VAAMQGSRQTDDAGNVMAVGFTGQIGSFQPGSSPAVLETWTKPSLSNSWANQGGGLYGFQYKMTPIGVWLVGVLNPASRTADLFFTLPVAYRPNGGGDHPVGFHTTTGAGSGAFLRVGSDGTCSIINSSTTMGAVEFNVIVPVDTI